MECIRGFVARIKAFLAGEDDGLVGDASRGDLISVLANDSNHSFDARTDAEVLSEIRARLQQEAWISGRGFL